MAQVAWPSTLPDCAASWQEQDQDDILRSSVDVGQPKIRRRSAILQQAVQVGWTLKENLYPQFIEFYRTTCLQSINTFPFAHPITGQINYYRFEEAPTLEMIAGRNKVGAFSITAKWTLDQ